LTFYPVKVELLTAWTEIISDLYVMVKIHEF